MRPNFFLLLALHPNEPWDQECYKKALDEKSSQWSRDSSGISKKARMAQGNHALLPHIHEVMEDATLREKEAVAARKQLALLDQAKYEQFEQQLALLNMKEVAEEEEVDKFLHDFQHIASPANIQKRITVEIRASPPTPVLSSLDASMGKHIADLLEILRLNTLYELLEASPQTATEILYPAAEELYAQLVRLRPTVEITTKMELAGFAMSIFKSDNMRARYDETLRLASLQHLMKSLDDSMQRATVKEVHPKQVLFFLENASKAGWHKDEALAHLKEYGRQHQWFIMIPTRETEIQKSPSADNHSAPLDIPQPHIDIAHVSNQPYTDVLDTYNQPYADVPDINEQPRIDVPDISTQSHTDVPNIKQLQYQILRSAIRLYWKWPADCQAVYISYTIGTEPLQYHTPSTRTYRVTRSAYDRLGHYDLSGIWKQHYQILISAIMDQHNVQMISSGIQISINLYKTFLTYEILLPRFLRQKRMLRLVADRSTPIPPLLLITRSHRLPMHKTDGDLFYRIAGQTNTKGEMRIDLPHTFLPSQTFGKLFLEDDRLYNTIAIRHPAEKQLRLR